MNNRQRTAQSSYMGSLTQEMRRALLSLNDCGRLIESAGGKVWTGSKSEKPFSFGTISGLYSRFLISIAWGVKKPHQHYARLTRNGRIMVAGITAIDRLTIPDLIIDGNPEEIDAFI